MVVSVSLQRKATYSTPTANLYMQGAHVRMVILEGSVIVTLMPARWVVSRVTQVLSALISHHRPMLLDTYVDPVHRVLQEMELSVRVSGVTSRRIPGRIRYFDRLEHNISDVVVKKWNKIMRTKLKDSNGFEWIVASCCEWFVTVYYNIHEKITQFWLSEKGVQFSCNTSANYKWLLISWKHKRNQREPIRLSCFNNKI